MEFNYGQTKITLIIFIIISITAIFSTYNFPGNLSDIFAISPLFTFLCTPSSFLIHLSSTSLITPFSSPTGTSPRSPSPTSPLSPCPSSHKPLDPALQPFSRQTKNR